MQSKVTEKTFIRMVKQADPGAKREEKCVSGKEIIGVVKK